jgi:hypothetical protein
MDLMRLFYEAGFGRRVFGTSGLRDCGVPAYGASEEAINF